MGKIDSGGTTYLIRGPFRPGSDAVSRSVLELALAMQSAGRNVRIVSWTEPDPFGSLSAVQPGTVVSLGPVDAAGRYTSKDRVSFLYKVLRYLRANVKQQDCIVTLEDPTALGLAAAPFRLMGIKHYIYVMDLQSIQYLALDQGGRKAAVFNKVRRGLDRLTWRWCDAVVVLGSCMQRIVEQIEPRAKVLVVPIWQDGARIRPTPASDVRRSLGVHDKVVVMYHGHATYRQPMDVVLRAAEQMKDEPDFVFLVIGNGPSVDWLNRSAEERHLKNVRVMRSVDDFGFVEVISSADVHLAILDEKATGTCVPSKTYTAMAVAKPCLYLGSPEGQAAVDIQKARAGHVLGTGEGDLLVKHLRELGSSDAERRRMGERGHEFFMRERELAVITQQWIDLTA